MKKRVGSTFGGFSFSFSFLSVVVLASFLVLVSAACQVDVSSDSFDQTSKLGTSRAALSADLTIDPTGLSTPNGLQVIGIAGLGVQATTGPTPFSAPPGTYTVWAGPAWTYGTFTVTGTTISATTGSLVASTPTSLTFDHSRLASVTIPLSTLVTPTNPNLFTLLIFGFTPPIPIGGPFGGDITFSMPDGHYDVVNGGFMMSNGTAGPRQWGSLDVAGAMVVSASGGFKASPDGHLQINTCAFATVHVRALPPPTGSPFGMPGLFNQFPMPTEGGDFLLLPGAYTVVSAFGKPTASFTVVASGPITNVVQQTWLEPITGAMGTPCADRPTASCVGTADQPVVIPTNPMGCGVNANSGGTGTCSSTPAGTLASCNYDPSTLGLGTHAVGVTATSLSGATSSCTSYVTVVDRQAPVINCFSGAAIRECQGPLTRVSAFAFCFDNCLQCTSTCEQANLPLGPGLVTCNAVDTAGNTSSCASNVSVVDTTPPSASVAASPEVLWPPDHLLHHITLTTSVSDTCDPAATITCSATTSEAPTAGAGTDGDIEWIDGELFLRAARNGSEAARVYTITCTASDASGNTSTTSTTVSVPRDESLR